MSTFVDFLPTTISAFSFQAVLGGNPYTITIPWNRYRQDYYVSIVDLSGNSIAYFPLVSGGQPIAATVTWDDAIATAACVSVHNIPIGSVANLWLSQTGVIDGEYAMLSTGATTLTFAVNEYSLSSSAIPGQVNFGINLVAPYSIGFLAFNSTTQQFEYA
jgi:hypothetical protein